MPSETGSPPGSERRGCLLRMKGMLCIIGFCLSLSVQAEEFIGRVAGITDGDMLTVLDTSHQQYKIRLMGIDAPERKQLFGRQGSHCPMGKKRRKRLIGKVLVNGVDVSLEQIKDGMAWWYETCRKDQTERDAARSSPSFTSPSSPMRSSPLPIQRPGGSSLLA